MKRGEKFGLLQILAFIKSGLSPAQISKKYKIPKQTVAYSVDKLKKLRCIEKKSYGVWEFKKGLKEVPKRPKGTIPGQIRTSEIRGHAFIWKIEFFGNGYDWIRVVKEYKRKFKRPKLTFQFLANGKVPRTIFNNRKIWLTKAGMIIYEPVDFLGKSSFQVKGQAIFEMDRTIKGLIKELRQKFRVYRFTTSREHFGHIKNELARQYNDRGERMPIRNESGTVWLWIDNSKVRGFRPGEIETNDAVISRQMQTWWNDHRIRKFEVTPTFILNGMANQNSAIQRNAEHLEYHAENMRSHVNVVKQLGEGVKELTTIIKKLKE